MRRITRAFQHGLLFLFYGVLRLLPRRAMVRAGAAAGMLVYWCDRRHRRLTQEQLQMAFPDWPPAKIRRTARDCYANLGRSAAEFVWLGRADRNAILDAVTVEGMDEMKQALRQGRGVLFLTAHLGNWELLAVVYTLLGYRLYPVARPLDSPWLDRLVTRIRSRHGSVVVNKLAAAAPHALIEALRRGESIGILLDQNVRAADGVFVQFLNRTACTAKGLALIARRTGAPVVPAFMVRENEFHHRMIFQPPVKLVRSGNISQDVLENTARCTSVVEQMVRAHPEQWLWMHRRWHTQPLTTPALQELG